jgi:hypothetical protein
MFFGRCEPTTGIQPFKRLVEQVMSQEPYASARRVFWVVDNGSSHCGAISIERLREEWPRAVLVHNPRLLVEPGRDLPFHRQAQGPYTQGFR